jgi:hypothetical protein
MKPLEGRAWPQSPEEETKKEMGGTAGRLGDSPRQFSKLEVKQLFADGWQVSSLLTKLSQRTGWRLSWSLVVISIKTTVYWLKGALAQGVGRVTCSSCLHKSPGLSFTVGTLVCPEKLTSW